jgi:hypothetical protein
VTASFSRLAIPRLVANFEVHFGVRDARESTRRALFHARNTPRTTPRTRGSRPPDPSPLDSSHHMAICDERGRGRVWAVRLSRPAAQLTPALRQDRLQRDRGGRPEPLHPDTARGCPGQHDRPGDSGRAPADPLAIHRRRPGPDRSTATHLATDREGRGDVSRAGRGSPCAPLTADRCARPALAEPPRNPRVETPASSG